MTDCESIADPHTRLLDMHARLLRGERVFRSVLVLAVAEDYLSEVDPHRTHADAPDPSTVKTQIVTRSKIWTAFAGNATGRPMRTQFLMEPDQIASALLVLHGARALRRTPPTRSAGRNGPCDCGVQISMDPLCAASDSDGRLTRRCSDLRRVIRRYNGEAPTAEIERVISRLRRHAPLVQPL